ncbi:DNA mismatch repair protein MutS [bacterium]|nr:DNA mismatch repair protein MutS [bacterium]
MGDSKRKLPPMLEEYQSYKQRYPDHFLFFQVGDFYELFFEDATQVASLLNITLTSRDKKDVNPIPMCGMPIAVVDGYLERLVDGGYSAAVVSQVSGPKSSKGMVERKLERVITPGVRIMSSAESGGGKGTERILAVGCGQSDLSLAWGTALDGRVQVRERVAVSEVVELVLRLEVSEVIVPKEWNGKRLDKRTSWIRELERHLPPHAVRFRASEDRVLPQEAERLGEKTQFSLLSLSGKRAVRTFVRFVDEATVSAELPFLAVELEDSLGKMTIDTMTRRNLELTETAREGTYQGSLLHYLDNMVTPGGKRLLRSWVNTPLLEAGEIKQRYAAVGFLLEHFTLRADLVPLLKKIPDFERICARVNLGIVSPRELGALRDGLEAVRDIGGRLAEETSIEESLLLSAASRRLQIEGSLLQQLTETLTDNPPLQLSEGLVIREGYDEEVDRLRNISAETKEWLTAYEAEQREQTGISSLKVRSNNAIGLYIEVTKANKDRVPDHYVPRQTLTNGVRFITEELRKWERSLSSASLELREREATLYQALCLSLQAHCSEIRTVHQAISELDLFAGFAARAENEELVCPEIAYEDPALSATGSWHPVLRRLLQEQCITNDVSFHGERRTLLLTGPNMGGKSTYLRQVGLLVLLAQIGSYVPAHRFQYGLFDRVFARLGASDDLHEGDSTFMVEMKEAAVITQYASDRSLVLIDELGRGTATADGLSLAKSLLEHLMKTVRCYCLFATHFHELIELEQEYEFLKNISVKVLEQAGEVLFTHEVVEGAASRSYGIEVARRAGLPASLIQRATALLEEELLNGAIPMEQSSATRARETVGEAPPAQQQLSLSIVPGMVRKEERPSVPHEILRILSEHVPDDISPREALDLLYRLQPLVKQEKAPVVKKLG